MAESKLSKIGEEVGKHTAWHFTGAPLLETATEKWKKWVGSMLTSAASFALGKLTGLGWLWAITIFCLVFGVFWFGWHYYRWRHVLELQAGGGSGKTHDGKEPSSPSDDARNKGAIISPPIGALMGIGVESG